MPRAQKPASRPKHDPLHVQLHEDSVHAKYGSVSQPGKRKKSGRDKSDHESEDEVRSMTFWGKIGTYIIADHAGCQDL